MTGRRLLIAACFVGPLAAVAVRATHVQATLGPSYAAAWSRTREIVETVPAPRGRILTSDGVVVAEDRAVETVEADYRWIEEPPNAAWLRTQAIRSLPHPQRRDEAAVAEAESKLRSDREGVWAELEAVAPALRSRRAAIQRRVERIRDAVERKRAGRVAEAEDANRGVLDRVWRELTSPPRRSTRDPLILLEEVSKHSLGDVPEAVARMVRERPTRFRGFVVTPRPTRRYADDRFATHAVGHVRVEDGSAVGKAGVERAMGRMLRGREGRVVRTLARDGTELSVCDEVSSEAGGDVTLTIDSRLQRVAERAVDAVLTDRPAAMGAVLLAVDVRTGAVVADGCGPRPSQRLFAGAGEAEWATANADPRRPLFPRSTRMAVAPGSVFKLVTAVAAVGSGWAAANELTCQGFFRRPDRERCAVFQLAGHGHGPLAMPAAVGRSCNVFFFQLAGELGGPRLSDWSGRLGVGWQSGCELSEASGSPPRPGAIPGDVRQAAIGQGVVTMTPLQVARLVALVANGGRLVTPRYCERTPVRVEAVPGLDEDALAPVREGMRRAVASPSGTARVLSDLPIGGKTGTAETGGGRAPHAWFVAAVPHERPRWAVVAVVEHGGSGGRVAAPMARPLIEALLSR